MRILIVDDTANVRQELRTLLDLACAQGSVADKKHQIEIVGEAADGLEAIRQVEALSPQVVLMDLEMPILDGFEATRQIKSSRPDCRVIALTVHGYAEARQRASQAGVDAVVIKGAPVEQLVRVIFEDEV